MQKKLRVSIWLNEAFVDQLKYVLKYRLSDSLSDLKEFLNGLSFWSEKRATVLREVNVKKFKYILFWILKYVRNFHSLA